MKSDLNQVVNQSYSVALPTVLLIIAIITICIMGFFLVTTSNKKQTAEEEINKLNAKISNLESTIETLQNKLNTVNTPVSTPSKNPSPSNEYTEITDELEGIDVLFVTDANENDDDTYTLKGVLYTEYTLTAEEVEQCVNDRKIKIVDIEYSVMNADTDGEYYVYKYPDDPSIVFDQAPIYYTIKPKDYDSNLYYLERYSQIPNVWKLTDDYKEITVNKDVIVEDSYTEEESTVEEVFANFEKPFPEETTNPSPAYTFKFGNGECVRIIKNTTAL